MLSVLIRDRAIAAPIPDLWPSRGPHVASDTRLSSITEKSYEDQTAPRRRKSRLPEAFKTTDFDNSLREQPHVRRPILFASIGAQLCSFFHKLRALIASGFADTEP
jgi:hypothetical protein